MKYLRHPFLAASLAVCLVLLGGAYSALAAGHTIHHAHHNANTHSTPFCTWLCAAGQVLQDIEFGVTGPSVGPFGYDSKSPTTPETRVVRSAHSRAPPSLLHFQ